MGRVIALQFHPEVNEDRIQTLIKRFGDEMINGLFVQKKEENARTARTSGQHKGIYVFSAR